LALICVYHVGALFPRFLDSSTRLTRLKNGSHTGRTLAALDIERGEASPRGLMRDSLSCFLAEEFHATI